MPADDVLDPAAVAGLRQAQDAFGDPAFIRRLVRLFEDRTPGKMDQIRLALAGGDAATVRDVAHSLKSNCGMLGAARMADACGRIEVAAACEDLPAAALAFADAESQLPAVLSALSAL